MEPSIVVLGTQTYNITMRSSKLIIKSNAHNVMTKSSFGHRFHDPKYIEVGFFFLEFILNLRAPSQKIVERHQFDVISSYFE